MEGELPFSTAGDVLENTAHRIPIKEPISNFFNETFFVQAAVDQNVSVLLQGYTEQFDINTISDQNQRIKREARSGVGSCKILETQDLDRHPVDQGLKLVPWMLDKQNKN